MEASVARCLRTPPESATPQGLISVTRTALRGEGDRSIVVVGNYRFGPITAEPCRAKAHPLRPRRSYFAPAGGQMPNLRSQESNCFPWFLSSDICPQVEAPGTAPGSAGFISMAVYRHSRIAPTIPNIGISMADEKACRRRAGSRRERAFLSPVVPTARPARRFCCVQARAMKPCAAPDRS